MLVFRRPRSAAGGAPSLHPHPHGTPGRGVCQVAPLLALGQCCPPPWGEATTSLWGFFVEGGGRGAAEPAHRLAAPARRSGEGGGKRDEPPPHLTEFHRATNKGKSIRPEGRLTAGRLFFSPLHTPPRTSTSHSACGGGSSPTAALGGGGIQRISFPSTPSSAGGRSARLQPRVSPEVPGEYK